MTSIRQRLVVPIVGGIFAISVITGAIIYFYARHALVQHFDNSLATKARAIAALVESEDDGQFHIEFSDEDIPEFLSRESPRYYQVWIGDSQILAKSKNMKNQFNLPRFGDNNGKSESRETLLPGGHPGRAVGLSFYPLLEINEVRRPQTGPNRKSATIVVARDRRDLDQTLMILLCSVLAGMILLPALSALIVITTVKRSLQPVHDLSSAMSRIRTLSAGDEIPKLQMPQELQPIADQLANLLERLRAAFDRERRFTMDASHELRTPLSETRTALEVALKWPDDAELMARSCEMALESTRNMQSLIDALLALARADSGHEPFEMKTLDLNQLISSCWDHLQSRAAQRNLLLQHENAAEPCLIASNPALLMSIITNLLDNAVEYSTHDTTITIIIRPETLETPATVQMQNTTNRSLAEDDLEQMFQPLWRKEESRAVLEADPAEKTHSGLGLALVEAFCRILKIEVQATSPADDQFQVTLQFPRSASAESLRTS